MKRFLSVLLASLMVLSLAAAMVVSTSAALEGDWVTSRSADDYEDEGSYCPAAGYHYDPELGFVVDPPEYAPNNTPFVQVHLKNPVDLKANNDGNGYSVNLKMTILEYAYDGGEGKDQWISFNLSSGNMSAPPSAEYGEGLCILIRGGGYGSGQAQPFYVDKDANWVPLVAAFPTIEVPMNDNDQEEYTFTVKYADGGYVVAVNGHEFVGDDKMNAHFDEVFAEGCYVNICTQTGVADSKISFAITEWQGDIPVGDDSAAPEEDLRAKAPIAPSENIPANEPAVLWDSTLRDFRKISVAGGVHEINEDGSVKVTAQTQSPYITLGVKSEVSYEAADFPYIAVLTRNCWANQGNVYYCAGDILSAENTYSETWDPTEYDFGGGWTMGIIDFSDYTDDDDETAIGGWEGRINSIRIGYDFDADDITNEEYNNFDVAFYGAFRSVEEATAYTQAWLTSKGYNAEEVTTEEPTTEEQTEAPTTDAPATTAPSTEAPSEEATTEAEKSGCGSIIAAPVVALVALLGVAFVAKKKD
ncbi:MAG: hypothetical protein IJF08_08435 [Clostridia bacterium]|nr:hypothetical protein [Clostridia bacterium]